MNHEERFKSRSLTDYNANKNHVNLRNFTHEIQGILGTTQFPVFMYFSSQ